MLGVKPYTAWAVLVWISLGLAAPVCTVQSFGALGVPHDDTAAIQAAIQTCSQKGGGVVWLGAGTYLSGPLFLHTGITLELDRGATLLGTSDPSAYRRPNGTLWALINAEGAHNIALVGAGTIDGQGQSWWAKVRAARQTGTAEPKRPRLIQLSHVQQVRVEGLTLSNSPSFHLVTAFAEDVEIRNITIRAPADSPNTDGIDPMSAHNVRISHCTIDTGDDNIAIKSGAIDPTHPAAGSSGITITDCTFLHGHGVSIGSETQGGVRDITVQNCSFEGTQNGLRIKTFRGRGGEVQAVTFRNLYMQGVGTVLFFAAYYPRIPPTDTAQPISSTTPNLHNIYLSGLTIQNAGRLGFIVGLPERPIREVWLEGLQASANSGLIVRDARVRVKNSRLEVAKGEAFQIEAGGEVLNEGAQR